MTVGGHDARDVPHRTGYAGGGDEDAAEPLGEGDRAPTLLHGRLLGGLRRQGLPRQGLRLRVLPNGPLLQPGLSLPRGPGVFRVIWTGDPNAPRDIRVPGRVSNVFPVRVGSLPPGHVKLKSTPINRLPGQALPVWLRRPPVSMNI